MMCQEVIELMQRYLDQDLDEIEYNQLLGHLKQCPDCTELFQRLMSLSHELENLPKVTPAFSLVDAILPQLQHIQPSSAADHMAASLAAHDLESTVLQNENVTMTELAGWRSRIRGVVSSKIVGGVVAAGLLLGFFVFEQQQQSGMNNADSMLMTPKAASSSSTGSSNAKKDSTPATSLDSNAAKNTMPALPSANGSRQDSQPTGETKSPAGSSKDLIPPSNVPFSKVAPGPTSVFGKTGGSADTGKQRITNDESLQTAPTLSNSAQQTPSSVVPQSPNEGFGNLQEPMKFGAQSPASRVAEPSTKSSPVVPPSAGSAKVPASAPLEQRKEEKVNPAIPGDSSGAGTSKLRANEMGVSSLKSTEVISSGSPDRAYKATVNEKRQVIITDNAGNTIFTGISWAESDSISLMDWSTDNKQLNYQVSNQSGTTSYVIHLGNKTELKK